MIERELQKDVTRHAYFTANNRTAPQVGTGNITLQLLDRATLRLRLPEDAPYSISRPEAVTARLPTAALVSKAPLGAIIIHAYVASAGPKTLMLHRLGLHLRLRCIGWVFFP